MERLLTLGLVNAATATLLMIVVAAVCRLLPGRPAVRHWLWLLVLLKLVTPPLLDIPVRGLAPWPLAAAAQLPSVELYQPSENGKALIALEEVGLPVQLAFAALPDEEPVDADADASAGVVALTTAPRGLDWWTIAPIGLAVAWGVGVAIMTILAAWRISRFRRLLDAAEPADAEVQELVDDFARRLGLKRSPAAFWVQARLTPMLWGVACRPRLILPRELWAGLALDQRSMLVVHELAHLRRGDHIVRLFELLVTVLFWWLPVVWWVRSCLRDAEEQCCDAWVVWAFPKEVRSYAETLLETVDFLNLSRTPEPLLASGFGRTHHLRRRLTMIMQGTTAKGLGWSGGLGALVLSATLLPLSPSWAQKPRDGVNAAAVTVAVNDDVPTKETKATVTEAVTFVLSGDDLAKSIASTKGAGTHQVHVVVKTDGEVAEVKSDSVAGAIDAIKKHLETIAREPASAEKRAVQVKALKQVLKELEKVGTTKTGLLLVKPPKTGEGHDAAVTINLVGPEHNPNTVADRSARLAEAKARVESLRNEVREKTRMLQKAEEVLQGITSSLDASAGVLKGSGMVYRFLPGEPLPKLGAHLATGTASRDRERIESLEKKLEKLLEEVSSLKKQGKPAK